MMVDATGSLEQTQCHAYGDVCVTKIRLAATSYDQRDY